LGILEKVGPTELTGGRFIAGTGTIDPNGKVGPIGGIPLKMIAARDAGAVVFLVPADNCDEATRATPSGLQLVKGSSLHQAGGALGARRTGGTPAGCCPPAADPQPVPLSPCLSPGWRAAPRTGGAPGRRRSAARPPAGPARGTAPRWPATRPAAPRPRPAPPAAAGAG